MVVNVAIDLGGGSSPGRGVEGGGSVFENGRGVVSNPSPGQTGGGVVVMGCGAGAGAVGISGCEDVTEPGAGAMTLIGVCCAMLKGVGAGTVGGGCAKPICGGGIVPGGSANISGNGDAGGDDVLVM